MDYRLHVRKHPNFPHDVLRDAYRMPTAAFTPYTRVNTHSELGGSTALLYETLAEHYEPGLTIPGEKSNLFYVLAGIRSLLTPGLEPAMKVGPLWGNAMVACVFALAKATPHIWSALTEPEKYGIDCLMRASVVTCSWATSDQNDYQTGPCLAGNYSKHWNPNHVSPHVIPILMAVSYFGSAEKVNSILTEFSYDDAMQKLQDHRFTNILRTWSPAGKMLFEEGGTCYLQNRKTPTPAGEGKGVKFPYLYKGMPLADTDAIFRELLLHNERGGIVTNAEGDPDGQYAYFPEGVSSPVTGMEGMMTEFKSHDALGIRSDSVYCATNFCILVPAAVTAVALGLWDPDKKENEEASHLTTVGVVDFLFKLQNGYVSFSKGAEHHYTEASTHGGYRFAKALWFDALQDEDAK